MSYIDEVMMPYEKLIYRTRPHWIIFGPAALWGIAFLACWIILPSTQIGQFSIFGFPRFFVLLGYLTLIIGAFTAIGSYITFISSEFAITDRRVLMKTGLIRRVASEIFLKRIESVDVIQSIPGRLLNYGTIIIAGTGGSKDGYRNIPDPLEFRKKTQRQIYESTQGNDQD